MFLRNLVVFFWVMETRLQEMAWKFWLVKPAGQDEHRERSVLAVLNAWPSAFASTNLLILNWAMKKSLVV